MTSSKKDSPNSKPVRKDIQEKVNLYEDEINLIDYLGVLWKRKYFIVLGSVLPALLVGLILSFSPRDYKVTYIYDVALDEIGYNALLEQFYRVGNLGKLGAKLAKDELDKKYRDILLERFYSAENLDNLAAKLREHGFDKYAQEMYGMCKDKIQLEVSEALLTMTVVGRPQKDVRQISLIVRDNLENVLPIYSVKKELSNAIAELKTNMAYIEENRHSLELDLEKKRSTLAKLRNLTPAEPNEIAGGITLHFENVGENSEYLPLASQIQAIESKIIIIEETIKANQEDYDYYGQLLSLNEKLFDEVKNKTSSHYGIGEFHSFLTTILGDYEGKKLIHYLNAYIKGIEIAIFVNTPIVENPGVSPVQKSSLKKTGIAFAALLMIATFGAFLLEADRKSKAPAS
jgi:hypothetical protein